MSDGARTFITFLYFWTLWSFFGEWVTGPCQKRRFMVSGVCRSWAECIITAPGSWWAEVLISSSDDSPQCTSAGLRVGWGSMLSNESDGDLTAFFLTRMETFPPKEKKKKPFFPGFYLTLCLEAVLFLSVCPNHPMGGNLQDFRTPAGIHPSICYVNLVLLPRSGDGL